MATLSAITVPARAGRQLGQQRNEGDDAEFEGQEHRRDAGQRAGQPPCQARQQQIGGYVQQQPAQHSPALADPVHQPHRRTLAQQLSHADSK